MYLSCEGKGPFLPPPLFKVQLPFPPLPSSSLAPCQMVRRNHLFRFQDPRVTHDMVSVVRLRASHSKLALSYISPSHFCDREQADKSP